MLKELLLVGTGGFMGSILRYLLSSLISTAFVHPINFGTLTVNILGSFTIGVLLSLVTASHWYFLAIVGFCGGFTTFSTFSLELFVMIREGHYAHGLFYLLMSVFVCVLFVWLGTLLGNNLK